MNDEDVFDWFETRLSDELGTVYTIVSPNSDTAPNKPYLILDLVPMEKFRRGLGNARKVSRGFVQVTVVTETNEPVVDSMAIGTSVAAVFPKGLRETDELLILQEPVVEKGYRDGPDWRTPVRIDYEAYAV